MKQSDIFSIVLVASIGAFGAFFVCQALMDDPNEAQIEFKTVRNVITASLVQPDAEVFNSTAINPTIEVYVGDCEDIDQNGILDDAELEACGRIEPEEDEKVPEETGAE